MPQRVALPAGEIPLYFLVKQDLGKSRVVVRVGENILYKKTYPALRPPEMERIMVDCSSINEGDQITVEAAA
jgi:hypothetical protein